MSDKGIIFVISGPSGCGKTTLCKGLLKSRLGLVHSVSVTTRHPRRGERRNKDYLYITEAKFKDGLNRKRFLEYAKVFGNYYGTPKREVMNALRKGRDVVLSIDVQGAAKIKRVFKDAVLIFILPPSFDDLKKRLRRRSADGAAQIRKRLKVARLELTAADAYNYKVINDDIKTAIARLKAIILAERERRNRASQNSLSPKGRGLG